MFCSEGPVAPISVYQAADLRFGIRRGMNSSAGQQLRQAREKKQLTLEQAAKATHIRSHYLQALEADRFDSLPSATQAKGFLRIYASFLNLDPQILIGSVENQSEIVAVPPDKSSDPSPPPSAPKFAQAEKIFSEIGQMLRNQRELLGLSLEEVEKHTHLRLHYLQALESGNLDLLPSPVQGRGMLSNYATFLGMDADQLLLRFAEGLQSRLSVKQAETPQKESKTEKRQPFLPPRLRRFFSSEVLIGGSVIAGLIIFVLWGAIRVFSLNSEQEPTATAPSISDILLASATPTLVPTPLPATPTSLSNQALFPTQVVATDQETGEILLPELSGNVQINISVRQRAWMRVLVDGELEFEGRILPGSAYNYAGESQVEILVSSGAAIQVFFNQQDLGTLGLYGQVVNQIYTPEGVLAPTPTITPTQPAIPTSTSTAAATPTPAVLQTGVPPLP